MNTSQKIFTKETIMPQLEQWQCEGEVVFTNGCFDIVHLGHVDYLEKARNLGVRMIVGLNTDASVSRLKGPERPLVNEYARARVMAAFEFVDAVILFDEPTPLELITFLKPDILVKGDDYTVDNIVGADVVIAHGGAVKTIALVQGYSTTSMVNKIKQLL